MDMYSINQEAYILLATIYGGIIIGFIYELYKVFRNLFRPKKLATNLQDMFFWSIITCVAFYVLIFSNNAQLRVYNFLGFLVGGLLYHYVLSKPISKVLYFLIGVIKNFFHDLWQLTLYPFRVAFSLVEVPYAYCKNKTKPVYYKSKRVFKLPGRMIYDTKKSIGRYFKKK